MSIIVTTDYELYVPDMPALRELHEDITVHLDWLRFALAATRQFAEEAIARHDAPAVTTSVRRARQLLAEARSLLHALHDVEAELAEQN